MDALDLAQGATVPVELVLGALYCLQSSTTKPVRQSVLAFHFFLNSLTNLLKAVCWPVEVSCALIEA